MKELFHQFLSMLEQLADKFAVPYHSRLEAYLITKHPQDVCELELLQREYERSSTRSL